MDTANATYLNNIGDAELRAVWTDPDFNPDHRAVYYARVLEIPTPTWQAYDAKFYGIYDARLRGVGASGAGLHQPHLVHAGELRTSRLTTGY